MDETAPIRQPKPDHPLQSIPIEVAVHVGRARPSVGELTTLGENAVLVLDRTVDDPVELWVGDQMIAKGQLQEAQGAAPGQLAVMITEVFALKAHND